MLRKTIINLKCGAAFLSSEVAPSFQGPLVAIESSLSAARLVELEFFTESGKSLMSSYDG
jgi:hypothetical protein